MRWDLFCRVIDNFGDIGVCWRLAADLGARGDTVRLWVDDASALAWMAPQGAAGVSVHPWPADDGTQFTPADAVIEAFGCHLPEGVLQRMAAMTAHAPALVWINLEYLSAEPYVERSHLLPSPQLAGPARGLTKRFFYPGFSARTGGLIREPDLLARQQAFDAQAWLHAQGIVTAAGERVVSLFCYENPALPALIEALSATPTVMLVTHGRAAAQVRAALGDRHLHGHLRLHFLPPLSQRDYDHLLWACDLNFVRGEDSFVRAQWAGRPFVWQIYPQHDGVHAAKLDAFLDRYLAGADPALAQQLRRVHARWNARRNGQWNDPPAAGREIELPSLVDWRTHAGRWRDVLLRLPDLTFGLRAVAQEAR